MSAHEAEVVFDAEVGEACASRGRRGTAARARALWGVLLLLLLLLLLVSLLPSSCV